MKRTARTASVRIMLTNEEKKSFVGLARDRHTDISELVRQLLHKELNSSKEQAA